MPNILFSVRRDNQTHNIIYKDYVEQNLTKTNSTLSFLGRSRFTKSILPSKVYHYDKELYASIIGKFDIGFLGFNKDSIDIQLGKFVILLDGTIFNTKELIYKYRLPEETSPISVVSLVLNSALKSSNEFINSLSFTISEMSGMFSIVVYDLESNMVYSYSTMKSMYVSYYQGEYLMISSNAPKDIKTPYKLIDMNTIMSFNTMQLRLVTSMHTRSKVFNNRIKEIPNSIIVLCSGGLVSTTLAAWVKSLNKYDKIIMLNIGWQTAQISYKQIVRESSRAMGLDYDYIDIKSTFKTYDKNPMLSDDFDLIFEDKIDMLELWTPARLVNIMSAAMIYAEANGIRTVLVGTCNDPENIFQTDTTLMKTINSLSSLSTSIGVNFIEPFRDYNRNTIFKLALELKVPLEFVLDCVTPVSIKYPLLTQEQYDLAKKNMLTYVPCGSCPGCMVRRELIKFNDLKDPSEDLYVHDFNVIDIGFNLDSEQFNLKDLTFQG